MANEKSISSIIGVIIAISWSLLENFYFCIVVSRDFLTLRLFSNFDFPVFFAEDIFRFFDASNGTLNKKNIFSVFICEHLRPAVFGLVWHVVISESSS